MLIHNCTLLTAADQPLIHNGYVRIKGNTIQDLGSMDHLPTHRDEETFDATNQLLMPGLINGHNHSAMSLFRGLADDLELGTWLNNHIFPAEARYVNEDMVYWCSLLSAAEMILSGTTTVADGYFHSASSARAFADAGLRAIVAHGVLDFPAPGVPDPAKNIDVVEDFIDQWKDKNPLITPAVFAHSPYTCSPTTLTKAKHLARKWEVPFFIHLAESRKEADMLMDPKGKSPVQHLKALDLLDPSTICIHAVWLDDQDLELLKESGAQVVVCPQSNCKLSSGVSRVAEMLERNIHVGLGTDGCASNNSLDMFREMDTLAKLHKVSNLDATSLSAQQTLALATQDNGKLLGQPDLGTLAVGNRADLLLIDLQKPHLTPLYNQDLLVYAARGGDVTSVIINGELVLHNRKLTRFSLKETMDKVNSLARSLTSGI